MITIVIATYNRAHTLPQALASCLAQTDKDIEVVVIDDGSIDDTERIVQEYIIQDSRIRYIRLEQNQGASVARNRGIQEAKGEWVMVWDSDDTLDEDAITVLKQATKQHPEALVISAPARMMRCDQEIAYPDQPEGLVSLDQILMKYLGNNEKIRMARKEVYEKARYVARNIDFVVGARLAVQGPWLHLNQKLGTVILDTPGSLTKNRKKFSTKKSAERAPHLKEFLNDFGSRLKKGSLSRYKDMLYGAVIACTCGGMKTDARRFAKELFHLAPFSLRSYTALLFSILFPGRLN